ncbi:Nudix domain protein [Aspergillus sclerotialis]|uniref:Nudix domain protein n=1 Tax=Aspergillus sclerotialis TaxID=2070753 RepID=A0A3A2ZWI1_9EURO|nr:Nudix domain protein [Aspergillus sclerotialis]
MEPKIGVGVFVFDKTGKIVLGKRKGSHGSGTWALPGGHLEFGESFEACAAREVLEETGLTIANIRFLTTINDVMEEEGKHYVTILMGCTPAGEDPMPKIMEPEKCSAWEWVSWEDIKKYYEAQVAANRDGKMAEFEVKRLFSPFLDLFEQRPRFHPVASYSMLE